MWMNALVKLVSIHEINSSEAVGFGIFARFLNFDNCQSVAVSDVISSVVDQDVGMEVCSNFGVSRLKPRFDGCEGSCKFW